MSIQSAICMSPRIVLDDVECMFVIARFRTVFCRRCRSLAGKFCCDKCENRKWSPSISERNIIDIALFYPAMVHARLSAASQHIPINIHLSMLISQTAPVGNRRKERNLICENGKLPRRWGFRLMETVRADNIASCALHSAKNVLVPGAPCTHSRRRRRRLLVFSSPYRQFRSLSLIQFFPLISHFYRKRK